MNLTLEAIKKELKASNHWDPACSAGIESALNKLKETSNTGLSYTQKANILLDSIVKDIYPIIEKKPFEAEINYKKCVVEILPDDFRTIWVKWGPYDCALLQLNATALATVADNILKQNANTQL